MTGRDPAEPHRAATPLELLFDLCFVVAVAQASGELHHALSEDHVLDGVTGFLAVFFAIWWAWVNFTWFASAYDTDDTAYRLTGLLQISGALVLAAGVVPAFGGDYLVVTIGYVIMRLAMVAQWLRAAQGDPGRRSTALRFAVGITIVQIGWVLRVLLLPDELSMPAFIVLAIAELLVPVFAERAAHTPWHPHHIAERYGLFTLIVLGETILAATVAVASARDAGAATGGLYLLAGGALIIMFGMWWLYFDQPAQQLLAEGANPLVWGYGHYLIFSSAAAVGAGVAAAVDYKTHHSELSALAVGYATAVPVAVFLLSTWFLHVRPRRPGRLTWAYPVTALLVLGTPLFGGASIPLTGLLLVALVVTTVVNAQRSPTFGT